MVKGLKVLLFILLSLIASFFVGGMTAKYAGAAKGQGLAGGPIIIFYGLASGVLGLIAALFINKSYPKKITLFNFILVVLLMIIGFLLSNK